MQYAPHILQKRITPTEQVDEFGRPIVSESADASGYEWQDVCRCRCDHNETKEIKLPDGTVIKPDYHIVMEGNDPDVEVGDYIRCLREDGSIRGEGKLIRPRTLNYLPYAEGYV